jgi:hypothetical protein
MQLDPPVSAPAYWRDRSFTVAEMAVATGVSPNTFAGWHRLMRAMGRDYGRRLLGKWEFSAHELFGLHLIAAIFRLGHPINADIIRAALDFADSGGASRPGEHLMIPTDDGTAFVAVAAKRLWERTLVNCESILEAAHV